MRTRILLVLWFVSSLAVSLHAATPVFDFEQDADVLAWNRLTQNNAKLERTGDFVTSAESAMRFISPTWKEGMAEWPAFETKPALADWTPFDRLVVDITNPNDGCPHFTLFISDSKVPFRKGLTYDFALPSRGFRRFEIPLSAFPKEVNRADIAILHFFTYRPETELTLILDNVTLLRPGEAPAEPNGKFVTQLAGLATEAVEKAEQAVAQQREAVQAMGGDAKLRERVETEFATLKKKLQNLRAELASPDLALSRLNAIADNDLAAFPSMVDGVASVLRFQKACGDVGLPSDAMLVGAATSMEKILPQGAPANIAATKEIELNLARNEKESVQIAVFPAAGDLKKVAVQASDLKTADGNIFKHENINCDVMGYVETKRRPPYGSPHIGFWPDPILSGLGPVDIAAGNLQTFWIRVRAPKDQAAGVYRGTLRVSAEGVAPVTLGFNVRVRRFTLPDHSPLPLAITFAPEENVIPETQQEQAEWRKSPDYPANAWRKHKTEWADFLADYYISYDSLYHSGMPDFEVLVHLHQQDRLGKFNLGYYGHVGDKPEALEKWKAATLPRLREAYAKAKELGLLDHAYIYGCDEAPKELFPLVEQAAAALKAEFPNVPVMTTTYDQSYGLDSPIKSMDAFCPLTPSFDPAQAAKARAAGKRVWWYICCGPLHPHANMFVEYPAIEGRLLMGAMTAKQRPDGFLYYEISIWNSRKPITSGPFTDWNPRSWTTFHGDGSWTCVGKDGMPVPTIRLENFRDGLEDYAYVVLLESMVKRRQAQGDAVSAETKQWLAEAIEALKVPETLVKTMTSYSRDPAQVYAWRNRIGDLLDRAGDQP